MKKERKRQGDRTTKNHSLSSVGQRPDEKNEQRNKDIFTEICQSSAKRLARTSIHVETRTEYQEIRAKNLYILSDCIQENTRNHDNQENERNPKPEKRTRRYRDIQETFRTEIPQRQLDIFQKKKEIQESIISIS